MELIHSGLACRQDLAELACHVKTPTECGSLENVRDCDEDTQWQFQEP